MVGIKSLIKYGFALFLSAGVMLLALCSKTKQYWSDKIDFFFDLINLDLENKKQLIQIILVIGTIVSTIFFMMVSDVFTIVGLLYVTLIMVFIISSTLYFILINKSFDLRYVKQLSNYIFIFSFIISFIFSILLPLFSIYSIITIVYPLLPSGFDIITEGGSISESINTLPLYPPNRLPPTININKCVNTSIPPPPSFVPPSHIIGISVSHLREYFIVTMLFLLVLTCCLLFIIILGALIIRQSKNAFYKIVSGLGIVIILLSILVLYLIYQIQGSFLPYFKTYVELFLS